MYNEILSSIGLNKTEIEVYNALLNNGRQSVADLTKKTTINRTNLYNILDKLEKNGLVQSKINKNKTYFEITHPHKLEDLLAEKELKLKQSKDLLSVNIDQIISHYNLTIGKPGIKIFEGKEAIKRILADNLTSKTEILMYVDLNAVEKYAHKEAEIYAKDRIYAGIKTRFLTKDSSFSRDWNVYYKKKYGHELTQGRFLNYETTGHETVLYIHDNKISFLILNPENMIGVIIENQFIYTLLKGLFEFNWKVAGERKF